MRPHAPQLKLSVFVFTHEPPQSVPLEHTHDPPAQYRPPGQTRPHAPQFALSLFVSTQVPPHRTRPPEQTTTHAPLPSQLRPVGQVPHEETQPDGEAPHTRPPQSFTGACEHTPALLQLSVVQTSPSEHAVLPHEKQPDGDIPQVRAPQSFAMREWRHEPLAQTSWVHGSASGAQPIPSVAGTQALPLGT